MQKQKNYACGICKTTPDQMSHHKGHLDTDKHQTKAELFKLQLEKLSKDRLLEKYNTIDYEVILEGLINITSDYILQIENKDTIEKDDIEKIPKEYYRNILEGAYNNRKEKYINKHNKTRKNTKKMYL